MILKIFMEVLFMKVYVATKAELFQPEEFVDVFTSLQVAESNLRKNLSPFLKKDEGDSYHFKKDGKTILVFIRPYDVKEK